MNLRTNILNAYNIYVDVCACVCVCDKYIRIYIPIYVHAWIDN